MSFLTVDSLFDGLQKLAWLSLEASLLVVLIGVAQRLFGRFISPRWQYLLWTLVLVKLLLPIAPSASFSLYRLLKFYEPVFQSREAPLVQGDAPIAALSSSHEEAVQVWRKEPSDGSASRDDKQWDARHMLVGFWLAGCALLLTRLLFVHYRLVKEIIRTRPLIAPSILETLEDCKEEMHVRAPINIIPSTKIQSPALLGFLRPRLIVPASILNNLSVEELRYVFLHELSHLRRGDIVVAWLTELLRALHWFNPVLYFAFRRIREAQELACDEMVVLRSKSPKNYGQTILKFLTPSAEPSLAAGMMGISERKYILQKRIRWIASSPIVYRPIWAVLLFVLLAGMGLTEAHRPGTEPSEALEDRGVSLNNSIFSARLPPGRYVVDVLETNSATETLAPRFTITPETDEVEETSTAPMGRSVAGLVREILPDGMPGREIADAQITFYAKDSDFSDFVVTTENGRYVATMPTGTYHVFASHSAYERSDRAVVVISTNFGVSCDFLLKATASSPSNNVQEVKFGGTVDERLLNGQWGKIMAGAHIIWTRDDGHVIKETTSNPSGRYYIKVPPGRYHVAVLYPDYEQMSGDTFVVAPKSDRIQVCNLFMRRKIPDPYAETHPLTDRVLFQLAQTRRYKIIQEPGLKPYLDGDFVDATWSKEKKQRHIEKMLENNGIKIIELEGRTLKAVQTDSTVASYNAIIEAKWSAAFLA